MAPKKRPAAKIESQISISGGSYIKEKLKETKQKSPRESIRIYGFFIELQSWDLKDLLSLWLQITQRVAIRFQYIRQI